MPNSIFSRVYSGSIENFPSTQLKYAENECKEVTLGDVHGNFLYLLYLLIYNGVITNCSPVQYAKLKLIYYRPIAEVCIGDLIDFNEVIRKLKFNTNIHLRLLGDEVCDRGENDYYTLKLFEHMHNSRLSFEILFSNHGCEFIYGVETQTFEGRLLPQFVRSLDNMRQLFELNSKIFEDISNIIDTVYRPRLKALSYTYDKESEQIILYTHAPIGLSMLKSLASDLEVPFEDKGIKEFIHSLDKINKKFQTLAMSNNIANLAKYEVYAQDPIPFYAGIENLIWNRCLDGLMRFNCHPNNALYIIWVHGHSYDCPTIEDAIYCLDTHKLGKETGIDNEPHCAFITDWDKKNSPARLPEDSDEDPAKLLSSVSTEFKELLSQFNNEGNKLPDDDKKAKAIKTLHEAFSKLRSPCQLIDALTIRMNFHDEIKTLTYSNEGAFCHFFMGGRETPSRKLLEELFVMLTTLSNKAEENSNLMSDVASPTK